MKTKLAMNRKLILLSAVFVVALAMGIIFLYHFDLNKPVASINGEQVEKEEFKLFLNKNRSLIYNKFHKTNGAEYSRNFWTTDFDGTTPEKELKQAVLQEIIKIKVQQHLAKQNGLLQDTRYSAFLAGLKRENSKRKDIMGKNGVIYGPQQYDEPGYYDYVFSNMVISLQDKLSQDKFAISDKKLREYFDSVKDRLYKLPDTIKTGWIYIPTSGDNQNIINEKMKKIKSEIEAGKSFDDIKNVYQSKKQPDIVFAERILDRSTARSDAFSDPLLAKIANSLDSGKTSDIFEENGSINLLFCFSRTSGGYLAFDECKDNVRKKYVEGQYGKYIDELVKAAVVTVDRSVVDSIKIE